MNKEGEAKAPVNLSINPHNSTIKNTVCLLTNDVCRTCKHMQTTKRAAEWLH